MHFLGCSVLAVMVASVFVCRWKFGCVQMALGFMSPVNMCMPVRADAFVCVPVRGCVRTLVQVRVCVCVHEHEHVCWHYAYE